MIKKMWLLPLIMFGMLFSQGTYYNGIDPNSPAFITDLSAKLIVRGSNSYTGFKNFALANEKRPDGKVHCVYSDLDVTTTFNREHTWCASWMPTNPPDGSSFEYSDYHNLLPTQIDANSKRGNLPFGVVVSGVDYELGGSKRGKDASNRAVFEPRDQHKGDAARILLYMSVCYNGYQNSNWSLSSLTAGQNADVLLTWHQQDPPDAWEKAINEAVFNEQNNRNPFVDHPEWTNYINFNNLTYIPQSVVSEPTNYPSNFIAGTTTTNSIQVSWTDAATGTQAPSGYLIQLKTVDNFSLPTDGSPVSDDLDMTDGIMSINISYSGADTYTFSGLSSGTYYYARIYSYNGSLGTINYKTSGVIPSLIKQTVGIANPLVFNATTVSQTQIDLQWQKNNADNNVVVAYSSTNTFGTPISGTAYTANQSITGGGSVLYSGALTTFSHTALAAGTTYYYKIWSIDGSNYYSGGLAQSATTITSGGGGGGVLLTEDFALCTVGSHATPDGTDIGASMNSYTSTSGWTGLKVYRSGTDIKIGSGSSAGYLITPTINISSTGANAVLNFDLQTFGTDVSVVQIFHAPDGSTFSQIGSDITATSSYLTKTVSILNGTSNSKIKFVQKNASSGRFFLDNIKIEQQQSSSMNNNDKLIREQLVTSNYPNPFNPTTSIIFNLRKDQQIELNIYNVAGKKVFTSIRNCLAGQNSLKWNADNLPAGIYLYNISTENKILNGKMSLIK